MDIRVKNVKDLTPTEYRACYNANYKWDGYMQEAVMLCRKNGDPGIAILLWDGPDDRTGSLKGWALLTPVKTTGLWGGTKHTAKVAKYTAQFWVKKQYRRQGLGKLLMGEVKRFDKRPHVLPHSDASSELFSSFDVTVTKYDRKWIKRKPRVA